MRKFDSGHHIADLPASPTPATPIGVRFQYSPPILVADDTVISPACIPATTTTATTATTAAGHFGSSRGCSAVCNTTGGGEHSTTTPLPTTIILHSSLPKYAHHCPLTIPLHPPPPRHPPIPASPAMTRPQPPRRPPWRLSEQSRNLRRSRLVFFCGRFTDFKMPEIFLKRYS
ncbi:uncharacterized protein LAJ45_10187 [Morchella importuna]|uniref:uncharacterized protein n=1 Tax=Morchella importuna TaxID=1174673 RepID=UPI001E8E3C0E|nr:uncharacterized protein LAJ45_10187 [Morchella importuna]KAH8145710.1 hypothetical protein LAJ45_10187 [Morchella importuna]